MTATSSYVVIGDTNVARRVTYALRSRGCAVDRLIEPTDQRLREALANGADGVAVLGHDDVTCLRYALAAAHIDRSTPLVVTIFDRTVGKQVHTLLPHCTVTSPADLAAPALAGPCLGEFLAAGRRGSSLSGVRSGEAGPVRSVMTAPRPRRFRTRLSHVTGLLRTPDSGARLLSAGLIGLIVVLTADFLWLWLGTGHEASDAFGEAVRVVATVGPAPDTARQPWYSTAASIAMLLTIAFTAMFTAGMVDRLSSPRLVGMLGRRVLPRSDHVIVVGLGQVGLRLCVELMALGVPVVAVERDPAAPNLRLVRGLSIPAVVGHGGDRALMARLGVTRARAMAAVGSDDLDNITVAIAAQAVSPHTRIVLRAGEHEAIAETRSLLPLGAVRDVATSSAAFVVATLLGQTVRSVVTDGVDLYLEDDEERFRRFFVDSRGVTETL